MNYYKIFKTTTGELLKFGTARECAEFIGIGERWFSDAVGRGLELGRGRYRVEVIKGMSTQVRHESEATMEAIAAWDAFTEPIRREFGIPVYRAKAEVRK